jgi:hypothetical protein
MDVVSSMRNYSIRKDRSRKALKAVTGLLNDYIDAEDIFAKELHVSYLGVQSNYPSNLIFLSTTPSASERRART